MTAYEMRISDWSSDVCSSDLIGARPHRAAASQMVQCAPGKVIAVPCAEKGRSPDEQMLISGRKDPVFSFRFAASVNRGGIDAISFAIRAFASIKQQIGREGQIGRAHV